MKWLAICVHSLIVATACLLGLGMMITAMAVGIGLTI